MRFRVSKSAQRELDEIYVYWGSRVNVDVAGRLLIAIKERFAMMGASPGIGRRCDDLAPGVRCFPAGKYLIYYRKHRGVVTILHVFHGARDQRRAFRQSGAQ